MTGRAALRQELSDRVYVESGLFWINACDADNVGGSEDVDPEDFIAVNADRDAVLVTSAAEDHEAWVTMTSWTAEPEAPSGEWDESAAFALSLYTGRIRLVELMGRESESVLEAGRAGVLVNARLYCRGRQGLAEAVSEALLAGQEPTGLEQFHLQVWPATSEQDHS